MPSIVNAASKQTDGPISKRPPSQSPMVAAVIKVCFVRPAALRNDVFGRRPSNEDASQECKNDARTEERRPRHRTCQQGQSRDSEKLQHDVICRASASLVILPEPAQDSGSMKT